MRRPKLETQIAKIPYKDWCVESFANGIIMFLYKRNENDPETYIEELDSVAEIISQVAKKNREYPADNNDFPF